MYVHKIYKEKIFYLNIIYSVMYIKMWIFINMGSQFITIVVFQSIYNNGTRILSKFMN